MKIIIQKLSNFSSIMDNHVLIICDSLPHKIESGPFQICQLPGGKFQPGKCIIKKFFDDIKNRKINICNIKTVFINCSRNDLSKKNYNQIGPINLIKIIINFIIDLKKLNNNINIFFFDITVANNSDLCVDDIIFFNLNLREEIKKNSISNFNFITLYTHVQRSNLIYLWRIHAKYLQRQTK